METMKRRRKKSRSSLRWRKTNGLCECPHYELLAVPKKNGENDRDILVTIDKKIQQGEIIEVRRHRERVILMRIRGSNLEQKIDSESISVSCKTRPSKEERMRFITLR
ncbi:hypothetical protein CDAR_197121 [Caerostris darwini]|uniref:Translational initiation factor 1 n=1 Tax=Caerostris darwini TaxID=1538125 RepID=A0AAV4M881_9ARAC|nr:hypothetical protein CDAR_197121 [Caerostris darwini]